MQISAKKKKNSTNTGIDPDFRQRERERNFTEQRSIRMVNDTMVIIILKKKNNIRPPRGSSYDRVRENKQA